MGGWNTSYEKSSSEAILGKETVTDHDSSKLESDSNENTLVLVNHHRINVGAIVHPSSRAVPCTVLSGRL